MYQVFVKTKGEPLLFEETWQLSKAQVLVERLRSKGQNAYLRKKVKKQDGSKPVPKVVVINIQN